MGRVRRRVTRRLGGQEESAEREMHQGVHRGGMQSPQRVQRVW